MDQGVRSSLDPLIDVLPWPAAAIAASGRVTHVNPPMEERGIRLLERTDRHVRSLFPAYCDLMEGDPPWLTPQVVTVGRQASTGPVHEKVWLRRSGPDACMIVIDETRLHELERGYAQNARLASLGFLLASVSHEINGPLSAISSMIQILQSKRGVSNEVRQKGTTLIAENSRRLLLITRKLTSFARVDDTVRGPFCLDSAIDEAFLQLRHDSLGETVDFEHQRDPAALVVGYQHQLQQVFFNLFLNAAQAMKGRGTISVVTERVLPAQVSVAVSDTGSGIPSLHLRRIFEPFFTTKPRGDGMGLGLAISNEIVQEHGGTLVATNHAGGGALFRLTLPLASGNRAR
jgi:signal transduction histidine kinase